MAVEQSAGDLVRTQPRMRVRARVLDRIREPGTGPL